MPGGSNVSRGGTLVLSGAATYSGLTTVYGGTLELGADAQSPVLTAGADIQGGKILFDYASADPAARVRADMPATGTPTASALIHDSNPPSNCHWWPVCVDDPAAHQVTATYAVPGDANLDGTVNVADLTTVLTNFGQSGKTWLQGDFDGDGKVTVEDLTVVLANFNVSAPQVTVNFGVTSSGIANVTANAGLVSSAVDLWPAFADVAGPSSDLTYKVTDDTNPSLFSSLQIDPASGRMTLAYAPQVLGSSELTVRATDSGGVRRGDVLGHGGRPGGDPLLDGRFLVVGSQFGQLEHGGRWERQRIEVGSGRRCGFRSDGRRRRNRLWPDGGRRNRLCRVKLHAFLRLPDG